MKYVISIVCLLLVNTGYATNLSMSDLQFGLGVGARYAGVGLTLEYFPDDSYGIYVAVGRGEDTSGSVGVNYYFINRDEEFTLRLIASYGFLAALESEDERLDHINETFTGLALGIGFIAKKHFEFSLMYRDMSEFDRKKDDLELQGIRVDSASGVGLSFGYLF